MTDNTTRLATSLTSTGEQRARRYRNESNVKLDLSQLIDSLGHGPVENEHTIPGGSIDIYVPHQRVVIETKARGLASDPHKPQAGDRESAKAQLDRYVLSEIRKELDSFEWDPERSRQPWTGVVTDGRAWHSWRYPHTRAPEIETIPSTTADSAEDLIEALTRVFDTEEPTKRWVPAEPAELFQDHAEALAELYRQLPRNVRLQTQTKQRLWLDMLRVSGMAPNEKDADRLFVTHTLLIAIARIVTHTLGPGSRDWKETLKEGFVSWITDSRTGVEWAGNLAETIRNHDWKRRRHDVMQSCTWTSSPPPTGRCSANTTRPTGSRH